MAITKPIAHPDESVVTNVNETHAQQASFTPHHHAHPSTASTATVDIEAWTIQALESLSVSPIARGTGTPLSIPLDHGEPSAPRSTTPGRQVQMKLRNVVFDDDAPDLDFTPPRRPPSRRDSMRRREALLKGNEGSRQRRRWENDRLVHVPNVQPPAPADFLIQATHTIHHVPYQLASYWERGLRERADERKTVYVSQRKQAAGVLDLPGARAEAGKVPRELRATAKRTPALKGWLRVLEEPVREFMVERGVARPPEGSADEMDSEDEEIVFVGRNGTTRDGAMPREAGWKRARREVGHEPADSGLVLDSLGDDDLGAFKRWLTHSISDYYGLDSRSVMVGKPARRVVYVSIKKTPTRRGPPPPRTQLPPPLWEFF
ncbi:hypothetical protein GQ53DRAFT_741129 [Thozetella sp. PMI_491]|nr:hypothetical protein GQ53DRAFT_741129 [Thozetella sp. PMI_491]